MGSQEFEKLVLRELMRRRDLGTEELYEELMEKYADELHIIREIEWEHRPDVDLYISTEKIKCLDNQLLIDSASSPNTSADA